MLLVIRMDRHGLAIATDDDTRDRSAVVCLEHHSTADLDLLQRLVCLLPMQKMKPFDDRLVQR